jgi:sentrin-specific protease 8
MVIVSLIYNYIMCDCVALKHVATDRYFEHDKFHDHQDILFMVPSVVQMLALIEQPNELRMLFGALNIESKKQIILPLNDHSDPSSHGGSHWCVLVYNDAKFEIFDSLGCSSAMLAKAHVIASRLHAGFGCGAPDQHGKLNVQAVNCPTQTNGYDCGVYAIAIAQYLASNNFSKTELLAKVF